MMERFAIKIDKKLKTNLYKICRLCGIDKPEMVPILPENVEIDPLISVPEPELCQKIEELIGFTVSKNDKMPQTMCTLCVDKINDFYEFREMCYSTNIQIRKLLGLKNGVSKKSVNTKPETEFKEESPKTLGCVGRKRKSSEVDVMILKKDGGSSRLTRKKLRLAAVQFRSAQQLKRKNLNIRNNCEEEVVIESKLKLKQCCIVCGERFASKVKLKQHLRTVHVPGVDRYVCNACKETLKRNVDIKNHQLWHKLTRTPYLCGLCDESVLSIYAFSKHLREHCQEVPRTLLVPDRECPQCFESFATNFLYNTHACVMQRRRCAGCNRQQRTEADYLRHAAVCSKVYLNYSKHIPEMRVMPSQGYINGNNEYEVEAATDDGAEELAHSSGMSLDLKPVVSLTRLPNPVLMETDQYMTISYKDDVNMNSGKRNGKKGISRKNLKRIDDLLKSTLDVLVSIKQEPELHMKTENHLSEMENDMESDSQTIGVDSNMHRYAKEDDGTNFDGRDFVERDSNTLTDDKTIKQELLDCCENKRINSIEAPDKMPSLKIKIKKEHGQLNSSLIEHYENHNEKRKKRKKQKDRKRFEKKIYKTEVQPDKDSSMALTMFESDLVRIKTEPLDNDSEISGQQRQQGQQIHNLQLSESTIMTSIPLMQLRISSVSSGAAISSEIEKHFSQEHMEGIDVTNGDIKPNVLELDRTLQITHVMGGVDITVNDITVSQKGEEQKYQQRTTQTDQIVDFLHLPPEENPNQNNVTGTTTTVSMRKTPPDDLFGATSSSEIFIKKEPEDRSYTDELEQNGVYGRYFNELISWENKLPTNCPIEEKEDVNFNFNSIIIKQEENMDITETQLTMEHIRLKVAEETHLNKDFINQNSQDENAKEAYGEPTEEEGSHEELKTECKCLQHSVTNEVQDEWENDINVDNECEELEVNRDNKRDEKSGEQQRCTMVVRNSEDQDKDLSDTTTVSDITNQNTISGIVLEAKEIVSNAGLLTEPGDVNFEGNGNSHEDSGEMSTNDISLAVNPAEVIGDGSDNSQIEEQQNQRNHELSQPSLSSVENQSAAINCNPQSEEISSRNFDVFNSSLVNGPTVVIDAAAATGINEETENRINESAEQQPRLNTPTVRRVSFNNVSSHNMLLLDSSNINEIAENNNNANIERELLDSEQARQAAADTVHP